MKTEESHVDGERSFGQEKTERDQFDQEQTGRSQFQYEKKSNMRSKNLQ
jgi:hypothetical protein